MGEAGTSNSVIKEIEIRPDENINTIDSDRISNLERNDSNLSLSSQARIQLQLVLPSQIRNDPNGFDSIHRRSRPPSRTGSVIQSNSPGFVNTRLVNYQRGISHAPSMISQRPETILHENIPPPSSEEEKSKMTRRYFATIFAISYAVFLVVFGAITFIGDAFVPQQPIPQIFCLFMLVVGIFYFIFLYIDIRMHISKAKKATEEREEQMRQYEESIARAEENFQTSLEMKRAPNGNINVQVPIPDIVMSPIKPISHRYCFATGRHGEFLYLKLGAAWFCFGLLIHSILSLTYQSIYFIEDSECRDGLQLAVDILFPIWALLVLFFIFKYCNIIINSYRGVARLLIMHAIGTSLAFWIFTIVRETTDAIAMKSYGKYPSNATDPLLEVRIEKLSPYDMNICPDADDFHTVRRMFSPYLYPFVIEFCILIVGIFYMMWANINHCPKKLSAHGHGHGGSSHHDNHNHNEGMYPSLSSIKEENHHHHHHHRPPSETSDHCNTLVSHDNEYKSSLVIYADCHAASRGLFAGMVLLILKIVFIILLHIAARSDDYRSTGVFIDRVFELTVLVIMIITTILAYYQTSKLDINPHPISRLDDMLLFIAIPAFFSETIFSMVVAISWFKPINIMIIMAQLVQVLLQTPWIIDALRRCANSPDLRKNKPGRELVTFLTVANVALWIYYTFSVKGEDIMDDRYDFFGDDGAIWSILNHLSLPLIMFYRFHASVCLVDIWRHSYEPGEFAH